jgi:hypothetical protein
MVQRAILSIYFLTVIMHTVSFPLQLWMMLKQFEFGLVLQPYHVCTMYTMIYTVTIYILCTEVQYMIL